MTLQRGASESPQLERLPATELAKKLASDLSLLMREEVELARRESKRELTRAARQGAQMGVSAVVVFIGALALTGALILLLDYVMPLWVAALIVGIAYVAGGAVLALQSKKKLQQIENVPKLTATRVKKDIATLQEAAR